MEMDAPPLSWRNNPNENGDGRSSMEMIFIEGDRGTAVRSESDLDSRQRQQTTERGTTLWQLLTLRISLAWFDGRDSKRTLH